MDSLTDGTLAENPSLILEVAASSFIGMGSTLIQSAEARKRTAAITVATTATGAAVGGGLGLAAGSIGGPFAGLTAAGGAFIGATRGFYAGLFGGVNGSIETAQTFGDQLRKEVANYHIENGGEPLEWNEENAKKVLSDPEAFKRIKNKAYLKGATVMGVDMIANAIAPGK